MYTKIDSAFWTDEKVLRMTPTARYVMLYLMTCPHRNMLGLYRLPKLYAQSDLRLSEKEFAAAWKEIEEAGMIKYDDECEVVFIRHFMRYHALDNGNQVKAAIIKAKELPRTRLLSDLADELQAESGKGYETLIETVRQRVTVTVTETHTETVTETSIKNKGEVKEEEKDIIPYQKIWDWYKTICKSLPQIRALTPERKAAIKARHREYGTDMFKTLFEKSEASDFLSGRTDGKWAANFDWLMKKANFIKVLEGNYDNKKGGSNGTNKGYSDFHTSDNPDGMFV